MMTGRAGKKMEEEFKMTGVIKFDEPTRPEPMPVINTGQDVLEQWFKRCVAQYEGASSSLDDLYDGFGGRTFCRFARRHAPDGVHISIEELEDFLKSKNIPMREAMYACRFDGIAVVMWGDVTSGNFGT